MKRLPEQDQEGVSGASALAEAIALMGIACLAGERWLNAVKVLEAGRRAGRAVTRRED